MEKERAPSEQVRLGDFLDRCEEYFAWSGCLVDQPFQQRLADGLIRCYLVHDEVVGFLLQWPRGLLEPATEAARQPAPASVSEGPETPAYDLLKRSVEQEWIPRMKQALGLDALALPAIWDADFLYGPKTPAGEPQDDLGAQADGPEFGNSGARANVTCSATSRRRQRCRFSGTCKPSWWDCSDKHLPKHDTTPSPPTAEMSPARSRQQRWATECPCRGHHVNGALSASLPDLLPPTLDLASTHMGPAGGTEQWSAAGSDQVSNGSGSRPGQRTWRTGAGRAGRSRGC